MARIRRFSVRTAGLLAMLLLLWLGQHTLGSPVPSDSPTTEATLAPSTASPTSAAPTHQPTVPPTNTPTLEPTVATYAPTTLQPTRLPTALPTVQPTGSPTRLPTKEPTAQPTHLPTKTPTMEPTFQPSQSPQIAPTTRSPTTLPTLSPTRKTSSPTIVTRSPTRPPTSATNRPTLSPTFSKAPTTPRPSTGSPTSLDVTPEPTTLNPSASPPEPSLSPSVAPSSQTESPVPSATDFPTFSPTVGAEAIGTEQPTTSPIAIGSGGVGDGTASPSNAPTSLRGSQANNSDSGKCGSKCTGLGVSFALFSLVAIGLAYLVLKKANLGKTVPRSILPPAGKDDGNSDDNTPSTSTRDGGADDYFAITDAHSATEAPRRGDISFALRSEQDRVARLKSQIENVEKENKALADATRVMRQEAQILAGLSG